MKNNLMNQIKNPTNHAEYHTRIQPRAFGVDLAKSAKIRDSENTLRPAHLTKNCKPIVNLLDIYCSAHHKNFKPTYTISYNNKHKK